MERQSLNLESQETATNQETSLDDRLEKCASLRRDGAKRRYTFGEEYDKEIVRQARRLNRTICGRARKKGLTNELTVKYLYYLISETTTCPYLGVELETPDGVSYSPNSRSVDRIVPELGYVHGNVRLISQKANQMKSDCTLEELEIFYENYKRLHNEEAST